MDGITSMNAKIIWTMLSLDIIQGIDNTLSLFKVISSITTPRYPSLTPKLFFSASLYPGDNKIIEKQCVYVTRNGKEVFNEEQQNIPLPQAKNVLTTSGIIPPLLITEESILSVNFKLCFQGNKVIESIPLTIPVSAMEVEPSQHIDVPSSNQKLGGLLGMFEESNNNK